MASRIPILAAALPAFCWGQPPVGGVEGTPIALVEGEALTTTQGADTSTRFAFEAVGGASYLIELRQLGLDFAVTVAGPSGSTSRFDSPLGRDESELVLIENAPAGEHLVSVISDEHTGVEARHSIRLRRLSASDSDFALLQSMSRGALANAGGADARAEAIAAYSDAAEQARESGHDRERAQALHSLAALEYDAARWELAAERASAAAELYAALGETRLAARADHRRAAATIELITSAGDAEPGARERRFAEAVRLLEGARAVYERFGDRYAAALAVNDLGLAEHVMGDLRQARARWLEATAAFSALGEWDAELTALSNQAVIDVEEGRLLDAIARLEQVVELLPEHRLLDDRAWTLSNLAATHRLFGNLEQALRMYTAALALHRETADVWGEAYALRGIGQAYYGLGELDLAAEYLEAALPKTEEAADGRGLEAAVRYLGNVAFRQGQYERALGHHERALGLATSPLDVAYLNVSIAKDLTALGRHAEAADLARAALATAEATETRLLLGDALLVLGQSLAALGDNAGATSELERAQAVYGALELRGAEADALHALAVAARGRDDLEQAVRYGEAALEAAEDLRARISHPELRAFNAALRRGYFDTQIDSLMTLQAASDGGDERYVRQAFDVSERARTRMLVDLLNEASVDLREGMDPELTAERDRLYDELAERVALRDALVNDAARDASAPNALGAVMGEMRALETELNVVEGELRRANPRYADLHAPRALSAHEVQALLDARTTLVQYALGDGQSHVWLITRDGVEARELAGRETIEPAARAAFEQLGRYDPMGGEQALDAALETLAGLVWAPIADAVDADRVLIAASGALLYVPFGALPAPDAPTTRLLERFEIVFVPSMSGIATRVGRPGEAPPAKTVAVFADPVLEIDDARLAQVGESAVRSAVPAGRPELARLPWTGREAEAIGALVAPEQSFVATGFGVTLDAVLDGDLDAYRYLHFATHGRIDSRHPELSALVMSRFDEAGALEARNELRLHDIYNLHLNADLVVLSACETALGRQIRGESLIGLTQGFMSAGARRVAATLWQVPDRATAELMTRFYGFMFTEGLRPAQALRRAQLSIASERRTRHPYFWAAFIMMGDWR